MKDKLLFYVFKASKRGSTQFIAEKHSCLFDILLIHGFGPDSYPLPVEKEVIVDTQCGAAVLRGADVFAPGVMGAHPGWWIIVCSTDLHAHNYILFCKMFVGICF